MPNCFCATCTKNASRLTASPLNALGPLVAALRSDATVAVGAEVWADFVGVGSVVAGSVVAETVGAERGFEG